MRKTVLAVWMVLILVVTYAYAAVQGDFVANVVDATTTTKFYRVVGSVANGMRVDVTRVSGTVAVTQSTSPWVVSGTVAATQGTSPWVTSGTVTVNNSNPSNLKAVVIEFEHQKIHDGLFYSYPTYSTLGAGLDGYYLITTPNTSTRMHFGAHIQVDQETLLYLYESPTASGGTSVTPFNHDRNSASTTTLAITSSPTVTANGTNISLDMIGSCGSSGGEVVASQEYILKQGTVYLMRVHNNATGTLEYVLDMIWYEN